MKGLAKVFYKNNDIIESKLKTGVKERLGLDRLHLPEIPDKIGLDDFYSYFDPLRHPETGEPVTQLADHQHEIWNDQYDYLLRAYPKSQKIFMSTTFLLEDIKHCLTDAMGMEVLIIGQSIDHSQTHLQDFKKLILTSQFKDYLITQPIREIGLERNEITKATVAYLHNPKNPFWPTKVYALSPTSGSLISWKRVKHVHMSDTTRSKETSEKQKEALGAVLSRLANSVGSCVYESPYWFVGSPLYEQNEHYQAMIERGETLKGLTKKEQQGKPFYVKEYDYHYGLKCGAFTEEFIEGEKIRLGPLFDAYYSAKPLAAGMGWYTNDMFNTSQDATESFMGGFN
jgi:hypothetical protein